MQSASFFNCLYENWLSHFAVIQSAFNLAEIFHRNRKQASSGRLDRPRCCFRPTADSENDAVRVEGWGWRKVRGNRKGFPALKTSLARTESLRALDTSRKALIQCQLVPTTNPAPSSAAL